MRQIYLERLSVLKEAAQKHLNGLLTIEDAAAGMRTIGWLPAGASDRVAAKQASMLGLEVGALSAFAIKKAHKPGLILGFAGCAPNELRRGVSVLSTALTSSRQ